MALAWSPKSPFASFAIEFDDGANTSAPLIALVARVTFRPLPRFAPVQLEPGVVRMLRRDVCKPAYRLDGLASATLDVTTIGRRPRQAHILLSSAGVLFADRKRSLHVRFC
jgi:hypothetical protein